LAAVLEYSGSETRTIPFEEEMVPVAGSLVGLPTSTGTLRVGIMEPIPTGIIVSSAPQPRSPVEQGDTNRHWPQCSHLHSTTHPGFGII
jgi:hypothetical protein